jgi:phage terminase large subunit-like protein
VRDACARHFDDIEHAIERGFVFDLDLVRRATEFFQRVLHLSSGDFEGLPFHLTPWEAFVVGSLFGWRDDAGRRRFRVAYIETGKGSGKSPLAAGIGLYMLIADGEPRAEVYAAASKKEQAMVLFRDAVSMVQQSPSLRQRVRQTGGSQVWNLSFEASFFRPISSEDGQSGPRPHCGLIDEVHEHRDDKVIEMMRAGFKGRRQRCFSRSRIADSIATRCAGVITTKLSRSQRACSMTIAFFPTCAPSTKATTRCATRPAGSRRTRTSGSASSLNICAIR